MQRLLRPRTSSSRRPNGGWERWRWCSLCAPLQPPHTPPPPQITYYVDARDGSESRCLHYSTVMPYGQVTDAATQQVYDLTSWMTWRRQVRALLLPAPARRKPALKPAQVFNSGDL